MEAGGGWLAGSRALTLEDRTELLQRASVYVSLHGNRRLADTRAHSWRCVFVVDNDNHDEHSGWRPLLQKKDRFHH